MLEPEEWVRQHVLHHLNAALNYPLGCMSVEHQLTLNGMSLAVPTLWRSPRTARPAVWWNAKPQTSRSTKTPCLKSARYNMVLNVPVLLVTNG